MRPIRRTPQSTGFTLIEVLVVITIVGLLIALLLPAIQAAREGARRVQCQNNLKQIGLALNQYHDAWHVFPAAYLPYFSFINNDELGAGLAWGVRILPYLEQQALYNTVNFNFLIDSGQTTALSSSLTVYLCPSAGGGEKPIEIAPSVWLNGPAPAQYVASAGWIDSTHIDAGRQIPGTGVFFPNGHVAIVDIIDGTSTTLMVGERSRNVADAIWSMVSGNSRLSGSFCTKGTWSVQSCVSDIFLVIGRTGPSSDIVSGDIPQGATPNARGAGADGFWSHHPGGCSFLFGDGSVRFVKETVTAGVFQALATRGGGEAIGADQF
jgi:prepilin-type N-terminal cleavage/methylation domain-containing protein/prepilin-type processing-associated H-X9-DG protein